MLKFEKEKRNRILHFVGLRNDVWKRSQARRFAFRIKRIFVIVLGLRFDSGFDTVTS